MRKTISLLLALALSAFFAAGSLADEFFSEESFITGAGAGEESFFEEGFFGGDFFAEDDFSGAPAEEPEGKPAEDGAQERTVLATSQDHEGSGSIFLGHPVGEKPRLEAPSVIDAKPNEVKLVWQHYYPDGPAFKSVKLPSGVAYYVYERDMISPGIWHQVAKTTSRTVTLKNQIAGYHTYFVRAEYTGKGHEQYGTRSDPQTVYIQDIGMWKNYSQVSIIQRAAIYGTISGIDPIVRIRTKEPVNRVSLTFTVKYQSGKSITWPIEYALLPSSWDSVPVGGGYEYETEINLNNTSFTNYASYDILFKSYSDMAKSVSVKVTPVQEVGYLEYIEGSPKTASLKKIYYNTSDPAKAKPVIYWVYQRGKGFQIQFSCPTKGGESYGIWDGNEPLTYYNATTTDPINFIYASMAKDAKPGAHKFTVAKREWDPKTGKWKMVGEKATYTLNIPAPTKSPVTIGNLSYYSGKITGSFWNNNPLASSFEVKIFDASGTYKGSYYPMATGPLAPAGVGYDEYTMNYSISGTSPFKLVITTFTADKKGNPLKQFVSDVYLTNRTVIPRKQ